MDLVPEAFLEFVEWQRVLDWIAKRAQSSPGNQRVRGLVPALELAAVLSLQQRTREAVGALDHELPDLSQLSNLRSAFAGPEEVGLNRRELFGVAATIRLGQEARAAFARSPALLALSETDEHEEEDLLLADHILEKIGPHGVVYNEASEALKAIRHQLGAAKAALSEALRRLCFDPRISAALLERSPVSYHGQQCLRVNSEEVRRVPGPIVHQQQKALLIQPDAAREHYNRIRHLEIDERAEEERICAALSAQVWPRAEALSALSEGLTQLDVHLALARFAHDLEMVPPELHDDPDLSLDLRGLRHPLLVQEGSCVPIDLALKETRVVVISGPNGGGKTVAMKALGLAAGLVQVGGFVPAASGRLPIFGSFQAVGEPQASLDEGVSTFQSHAQDLAAAVGSVQKNSLSLLDEIGTGTDPAEAAALAQAVLEHQLERGGLTLTTTHLGPLKSFAERTSGAANAAVGLNEDGQPTFELHVGESGRSFALDMARAKGLPEAICERARRLHAGEGR